MKDMFDRPVSVGSYVAFVGGTGNVSSIKIGLVKKLGKNGASVSVVERWYSHGDWRLPGVATGRPTQRLSHVGYEKVMTLPKDWVTKEIVQLLK